MVSQGGNPYAIFRTTRRGEVEVVRIVARVPTRGEAQALARRWEKETGDRHTVEFTRSGGRLR